MAEADVSPAPPAPPAATSPLQTLRIDRIRPNPFQPRRDFEPEELADLERSMRENGLLQPVTVRPRDAEGFELVAGERRLRAAVRLGWTEIPAILKLLDDRAMLTLALVENLQRADLNPLDEALGYQRLIEEFALTPQDVAHAVGKDRSTVANLLRVLQLPEGVRRMVRDGSLSVGHARALLAMPDERRMLDTAQRIVDEGLSVRAVERLVQSVRQSPARASSRPRVAPGTAPATASGAQLRRLTDLLRQRLQTDVRITADAESKGELAIRFYSADDLHRLLELIIARPLDDA